MGPGILYGAIAEDFSLLLTSLIFFIFYCFLELESSNGLVDLDQLIGYCSTHFDGAKGEWKNNFNSMKTDLGNAHGKIFFTDGNRLKIYSKARREIDKFNW